jgi:hypothetical protein
MMMTGGDYSTQYGEGNMEQGESEVQSPHHDIMTPWHKIILWNSEERVNSSKVRASYKWGMELRVHTVVWWGDHTLHRRYRWYGDMWLGMERPNQYGM